MNSARKKLEKTSVDSRITYLYIGILFFFVVLSIFVSIHHEPWADEANPWLMAKGASVSELFTTYLHSEGHPALWYLVLKVFQWFGLKYNYFFIIPIIFSTLGVAIFLFQSNFKMYLKILFPFTYFIFYQYTIVARGYCLILLLLSLLAWIYPKRKEKCLTFSILLILLLSLESYTYLLSGSLFLLYLYDYYQLKKEGKKNKKYRNCLILLFFSFLLTAIYVFPSSTYSLPHQGSLYSLSDSFFTSFHSNRVIKYFSTIFLLFLFYFIYQKQGTKRQKIEVLFFLLPIIAFFLLKYHNLWHLGIILEVFLFCLWIHHFENSKVLNIVLLVTFLIQISWSISSTHYDIKNNYSSGKEVANFIKQYDYQNMDIYGMSYYDVVVNPYFSKNIYKNWEPKYSFFYLDYKNRFYHQKIDENFIKKEKPDMIVNSTITKLLDSNQFESNDYHKYVFKGFTYIENQKYENQEIVVYVRKEKDIKKSWNPPKK